MRAVESDALGEEITPAQDPEWQDEEMARGYNRLEHQIMRSLIATTGWDAFVVTPVECV